MKNVFYFSRRERMSLCLWAVFLMLMLFGLWGVEHFRATDGGEDVKIDTSCELERFMAGVQEKHTNRIQTDSVHFAPHPFDPNTCDSAALADMGLKAWQIGMFLKYRKAGARFYNKQDLMRVYSFSEKDVDRMMPYALFPVDERVLKKEEQERKRQHRDSVYNALVATYPQKLKEGEWVELGVCDTTQLKMIPGVGSYYASKIVHYGEDICKWVRLSGTTIKKLRINKLDFKSLIHHPYLNYEQVKTIFNHRSKYGDLKSLRQLSTEPTFTDKDLQRLEPYISFD